MWVTGRRLRIGWVGRGTIHLLATHFERYRSKSARNLISAECEARCIAALWKRLRRRDVPPDIVAYGENAFDLAAGSGDTVFEFVACPGMPAECELFSSEAPTEPPEMLTLLPRATPPKSSLDWPSHSWSLHIRQLRQSPNSHLKSSQC